MKKFLLRRVQNTECFSFLNNQILLLDSWLYIIERGL